MAGVGWNMYFFYAVLGLIIGGTVAGWGGDFLVGAVGGAMIGVVLAHVTRLDRRIRQLESSVGEQPPVPAVPEVPPPLQPRVDEAETAAPLRPPESSRDLPERDQAPVGPSLLRSYMAKITAWFTTGNVPVKLGVIISFFGVAFLLKYAVERELMVIPLEFRLLAVAAAGVALIVIGWRLREKTRVYALSLQGGGAGILFLTIFAALQLWQLLPAPLAFLLLVALTFATGALAGLPTSRSVALLGIVGGFLAPVLASTGQGSHVILFSYYLVLNGAILGIAWFRAWRELNLVGFVFTFLIGSLWGYQYYQPGLWASTQPFLVLYFLFYQAIAILYALRQPPERLGIVDGTLVFGTPAIVFALQAALVDGMEYGLATSAAAAAVFYALTSTWLFRNKGAYLRLLSESFLALAVAFATITIPLALDARWTAAAWALEGAALVWVGTRQGGHLAKFAGVLLIFFSGVSLIEHGWRYGAGLPILNGNVLGGVLLSVSAFFASRKLETFANQGFEMVHRIAATGLFVWGALWWIGTGWMEINERASTLNQPHVFLLFLALSMGAGAWLGRARQWEKARRASLVFLPLLVLLSFGYWVADEHFLFGLGWLAWPAAWLIQVFVLRVMDEHDEQLAPAWHFGSLLLLTGLLALEASWRTELIASSAWAGAAATTVMGIMALLVWRFRNRPAWPVPGHPMTYLFASVFLVAGQVICLAWLSLVQTGDPAPWPYVPVVNPFDLAMLFALLCAMLSLAAIRRESGMAGAGEVPSYLYPYRLMLAAAFFIMTTLALVRAVHHLGGVPWNIDALYDSVIVQTALSIYWGLLGFAGMIWGTRSTRRPVWLTGAGFMALVVIKLFLVDLGNSGTIERIISFIGIGALLLVVGYFAPAPPGIGADEQRDQIDP